MSQFKRQRINPLPGGRNFSGAASTSLLGPPPGLLTPPVATDLSQNARHLQGGEKQRVFTGIVTSLHDYFGVVDEEVFFQLSVVKGRLPQLGEKVLVKAAYNPGQAVPWNAVKVQTLSNQPLLKSPAPPLLHVAALGQKQGILGAQPQLIFQPHRIPPLFPQKPLSLFQTSHTLHLSHLNRFPARGPHGRLDQGRSDDYDSKKRKQRAGGEPWGAKKPRHDLPPYRVHLTPYTVDSPVFDFLELQRRYRTLLVPSDFLAVHLSWLSAFPVSQPFSLHHPSRIQVSSEKEPAADAGAEPPPTDSDPTYSSKVLLLSSPGLEELYRCCMLFVDDMAEPRETPEHPLKQIKFLLGWKDDEAVLVGGEWSPSLDGLDPKGDPQVLVRTATRCAQAQAGIDLSACTKWWRFAEFQYLQAGPPRRLQTVVVYLPDIWTIMPTLEEWEALCQQKAAEAAPPPPEVPVETEPTEQPADGSEQAADTSKSAENPEVTAQQEVDTDLPEAPPPPLEPGPPAGRGGVWRSQPGLAPGLAGAAGALPRCLGRVAALASSRRELSLSAGNLQLDSRRREFTSSGNRKLYFDTHALVCVLEENGFTTQQAEVVVSALIKIMEANMDIIYKDMVTKMQQEITLQQIMSQIANVKKDMIILEKSEFSALRSENEKIKLELHRLKQQVMDEVIKVRTDTKLDFNLEKSRVKELYSLNERKLLEIKTEMVSLHAQQDRAVTQTDRKIDTEVAGLKTMLESHKLDNIKYLAGSVFTCLTVALGFYRLWI